MSKIILTESQVKRLIEQGGNFSAMDLDIYTQPTKIDTNNGNLDVEDTVENIISKLQEVLAMFKTGKKVHPELKDRFFEILDKINSNFENIKYED
jgi:hypothetical protein